MLKQCTALALVAVAAAGCTTVRETQPTQTAREQLIMSTAADLASEKITPNVPKGNTIFVDSSHFADDAEYRTSYAVARIQAQLLKEGYKIAGSADKADTIAEVSTGALSIDQADKLFGIPSAKIPIPLSSPINTPQLAIYKKAIRTGVAKFNVAFYDAKSGSLEDVVGPVYGFSHYDKSSIFGFGWKNSNLLPPAAQAEMEGKTPKGAAAQ
ncbi:MAG: hypothetical protein PF501_20550 [Salinisphaera sp.]|jgi:hypothetical protein|nr:hypothetical protein [Salinisphaera sp.]